jgi:hypothetical protein
MSALGIFSMIVVNLLSAPLRELKIQNPKLT